MKAEGGGGSINGTYQLFLGKTFFLPPSFLHFSYSLPKLLKLLLFGTHRKEVDMALLLHVGVAVGGSQRHLLRDGDSDSCEGTKQLDAEAEQKYESRKVNMFNGWALEGV